MIEPGSRIALQEQTEAPVPTEALRGWLMDTGRMREGADGQLRFAVVDRLGYAMHLAQESGQVVFPSDVAEIYQGLSEQPALSDQFVEQVVRVAGVDYTPA